MEQKGLAFPNIRRGLAGKLALSLVLSTLVIFAVFGYINLRFQRRAAEELLIQSADRITDVIKRSTRYQMMHNDREGLYQVIRDMGSEPGIRRVRIFNKEGRITFSTDLGEVNRVVDKQAEACYGCHSQGRPLEKLARPDRARVFEEPGGEARSLGLIKPIENQPECSNAACHAHPQTQRILGVIDANLSLAGVDEQLATTQRNLVMFTGIAVLLICVVSIWFIWEVVYLPIRRLITGTHRVAGGDLAYRLPVSSADELGDLAISFNKMTSELASAHGEITEWARTLEERVEKKTSELERAHTSLVRSEKMASLGKLAATVAHEVNNPLFGILTYARLCLKEIEQEGAPKDGTHKLSERLKLIERESRRCGDIIRNLLTFARQAPQRREPNNLNELVERALALVRHQLDLQGIELEKDLAPDLPPVSCDAGQFQQVVLVLFVNAAEAMGNGGKLMVSTSYDQENDQAVIDVQDTGPGIPAEVIQQVFDPFFTTKDDKLRTGLGLAVARSIIEQHAGSIAVTSQPGQGAHFVITLPRQPGTLQPAGATAGNAHE
jgi:two-component system, NtrC family, sensor kinase